MDTITFCTGSIFHDVVCEGGYPLAGLFLCPSGSIRTMVTNPTSASIDEEIEYAEALNIITYLLYALDKPEWFKEYSEYESRLALTFQKEVETLERQQRRSHLQLIKGGKSEKSKS